jgi:hypothetical protein
MNSLGKGKGVSSMRWSVLAIAMFCLLGCGSGKDREQPEIMVSTPLEFDPTEQYELSRWWSNGTQLLRLDENAGYELFSTPNRYNKPVERGRWDQQSYAVLWLEPYSKLASQRKRVSITKRDGRLALLLPKLKPMFAIESPPAVIEDRLIGTWQGPIGELTLQSDLRYTLRPDHDDDGANQPAIRGVENGRWIVAASQLLLQPDAPGLQATRMSLTIDPKKVVINAPGGALSRQEPAEM